MKKKILIATFIVVLCCLFIVGHAQQSDTINFSYDFNGNRILSQIVFGNGDKDNAFNVETDRPVIDSIATCSISVFPNPTEGKLSISIDGLETTPVLRAAIITTTGELIHDKPIYDSTEEFDLTQQSAGIYLLRLMVGNECKTWKIIKK